MKAKVVINDFAVLEEVLKTLRHDDHLVLASMLQDSMTVFLPRRPMFEELATEVAKLDSLCKEPEPGLLSWHVMLEERMRRTLDILVNKLF